MRFGIHEQRAVDRRQQRSGARLGVHKACAVRFCGILHGIRQPARRADHRHRAVALAVHLVHAARLEPRRHQENVGAGFEQMRERLVEIQRDRDVGLMRGGQRCKLALELRVATPQHHELETARRQRGHDFDQPVDAFLLGQPRHRCEQRLVDRRQARAQLHRALVVRFIRQRRRAVITREIRVARGVPRGGVDAVQNSAQVRASVLQQPVQAGAMLLGLNFGGISRAHRRDRIRVRDAAFHARQLAVILETVDGEAGRGQAERVDRLRRKDALEREVVDREHGRRARTRHVTQVRGRESRLPVVAVDHVGRPVRQRTHRRKGGGTA